MTRTELAVIGAGPAGLAAATTAAAHGVQVTLIDELPAPGGQYLAPAGAPGRAHAPLSAAERRGHALLDALPGSGIDVRSETIVWNMSADRRMQLYHGPWFSHGGQMEELVAQVVILACGAREVSVPFPGWTLPGVMTAGGAQLLAKRHGLAAGKRVLVAGSGPLLLPTAERLARVGATVVAIVEAAPMTAWMRLGTTMWGQWDRVREGIHYGWALLRAGIPYRFGRAVTAAHGHDRIASATIARLDAVGRPIPGSETVVDVDALCVSFGLTPNAELAQLAGCEFVFEPQRGGWTPVVGGCCQTSLAGVLAVGDMAAVEGAAAGMLEGRLAGLQAAHLVGRLPATAVTEAITKDATARRRYHRFGAALNTIFAPPDGLFSLAADDTIVCRCEEVTAGEVRKVIAGGVTELDSLKQWTRVGQGPCQGRTCGPILAQMIAQQTGRPPAESGVFHVRPPAKPVPLAALAASCDERDVA